MHNISTRKTEKQAVNKFEDLILRINYADYNFNVDDTGISWDGEINLYHGIIDNKENFDYSIKTQIKGRSTTIKRLQDKRKFDVDKVDLENYLKEDGTMFLLALFKDIDDFKLYYAPLLPYNLRKYLKEQPNSKNQIKIKLKEIKDAKHFEKVLRDFAIDKQEQKRISENVFEQGDLLINNENVFKFYDWRSKESNIVELLGEEKYLYQYDELNNITNITCAKISKIKEPLKINISNKSGQSFYSTADYIITSEGNRILFGNTFELDYSNRIFNFKIQGTLNERCEQLNFIKCVMQDSGFIVNEDFIPLIIEEKDKVQFNMQYDLYNKINNFLKNHKITKDLDLEKWSNKDINDLMIWISSIDDHKPIKIKELDISAIGSIKINELRFSIFADKRNDGGFDVYSLWNTKPSGKYIFTYKNSETQVNTKNFYSVLNKQAYASDDVNIDEMKKEMEEYKLVPNEELLLNLQVLEIIKAYDYNNNDKLLDYALYLIEIIENYESIKDVVYINRMQICKRKNMLSDEMKLTLLEIKNRHEDLFYKISVDLLIDNNVEAKLSFSKLNNEEQILYKDFPISIYL